MKNVTTNDMDTFFVDSRMANVGAMLLISLSFYEDNISKDILATNHLLQSINTSCALIVFSADLRALWEMRLKEDQEHAKAEPPAKKGRRSWRH